RRWHLGAGSFQPERRCERGVRAGVASGHKHWKVTRRSHFIDGPESRIVCAARWVRQSRLDRHPDRSELNTLVQIGLGARRLQPCLTDEPGETRWVTAHELIGFA